MLHPKYKRQTDYCCCTGTVHCRYCVGQGKPPIDKDYNKDCNTVSIASKACMDRQEKVLQEYCKLRIAELNNKEPINELTNMNDNLKTQNQFILSVKRNNFIVGSVREDGTLSFAGNPTVHASASAARTECARLARLSPGKLYIFVQLAGGELSPTVTTVSI